MGLSSSMLCTNLRIEDEPKYRGLMLGLEGSGKTTILYQLKLAEAPSHGIQTVAGKRVERVDYGNIAFTVSDVGVKLRKQRSWRRSFGHFDRIIFVVDSSDSQRMKLAKEELHRLSNDDTLLHVPILVFANKQDLPNAMRSSKLVRELDLNRLRNQWRIQPCCTITGEGLYEGLDWLSNTMK